jgi:hypothetical protein
MVFYYSVEPYHPVGCCSCIFGIHSLLVLLISGPSSLDRLCRNRINTNPGSPSSIAQARGWMLACMEEHTACPKPSTGFLPKRLLKIDASNPEIQLSLRHMNTNEHVPYVALSYCWGGDQRTKLTHKSISQFTEGFNIGTLPKSLQDGVFVTQQLGISFIWIDALCILQDDEADKIHEIPLMGEIYSQATVTIAASNAETVNSGFLNPRSRFGVLEEIERLRDIPFDLATAERVQPPLLLQAAVIKKGGDMAPVVLRHKTPAKRDVSDWEPLTTRGWAFQERMLSHRYLDYTLLQTK